jgi:preprotein translocase subunit SecA
MADGETLDDLMPEAFATVREAAKRVLGQRHFDVQIMGGAALHFGNIAEMKTGEGKTLVATLPAYLNASRGEGVHVVTVNDYLAKYHAEHDGPRPPLPRPDRRGDPADMTPAERREAPTPATSPTAPTTSSASTTCATTWRTAIDGLRPARPQLRHRRRGRLDPDRRGPHPADHQRPDRTRSSGTASSPSIAPPGEATSTTRWTRRRSTIGVLEPGITKVEDHLGIDNLYDSVNTPLISYLNNAIKAKELFHNDKEYVVMDGEVLIVDEHTGRILAGRRYNEGLHQAIEAKEGVEVQAEYQTLATITLQNYFRLYDKLSGMTGTADDRGRRVRQDLQARRGADPDQQADDPQGPAPTSSTSTEEAKYAAVVDDIVERHAWASPC